MNQYAWIGGLVGILSLLMPGACRQKENAKPAPSPSNETSPSPAPNEPSSDDADTDAPSPAPAPGGEANNPKELLEAQRYIPKSTPPEPTPLPPVPPGDALKFQEQYLTGKVYSFCPTGVKVKDRVDFAFLDKTNLFVAESQVTGNSVGSECQAAHVLDKSGPTFYRGTYKIAVTNNSSHFMITVNNTDKNQTSYYLARFAGNHLVFTRQFEENPANPTFAEELVSQPAFAEGEAGVFKQIYLSSATLSSCAVEGTGSRFSAYSYNQDVTERKRMSILLKGANCDFTTGQAANPILSAHPGLTFQDSSKPGLFRMITPEANGQSQVQLFRVMNGAIESKLKAGNDPNDLEFSTPERYSGFYRISFDELVAAYTLEPYTHSGCRVNGSSSEMISMNFRVDYAGKQHPYTRTIKAYASTNCTGTQQGADRTETGTFRLKGPFANGILNLTLSSQNVVTNYLLRLEASRIVLSLKPDDSGSNLTFTSPIFLSH